MPKNEPPVPAEPEGEQLYGEIRFVASAHAVHPEGAVVAPPFPNPALNQE